MSNKDFKKYVLNELRLLCVTLSEKREVVCTGENKKNLNRTIGGFPYDVLEFLFGVCLLG